MDTLILQRSQSEKTATSAAGICIALCLLLIQNLWISAKDLGGLTGISPEVNYLKDKIAKEELFEKEIKNKYKNGVITEVDKGIKHIRLTKYYNGKPVRINIVELSQEVNGDLAIEPAIASNKTLASRSKITNIASRENAIVAINGGYFKPQTGTPLGTLMINGKVYTGPIYDRVAMGIFADGYDMARVQLKTEIITNIGGLNIDNVNQPRMLSTHALVFTPDWGEYAPPAPKYGVLLIIKDGKLAGTTTESCRIPENGFVISGPASKLNRFLAAKKFSLNMKLNPEWNSVKHIISGGPYLVKNGEVFVDMSEEKLSSVGGRNPRTAIGYTKDNHLIMLTADGREGASIGLTLNELASIMKHLGCVNAMNLDGGGSTVMLVKGQVVNKPAVQGGIPLSHTLVIRNNYKLSKI